MRIIAGTARGIPLVSPQDARIRPTLDRVRESLFNILAGHLPGCNFLDLFSGTGANGIEALSRGAAKAVFVDNGREALTLARTNLEKTRLQTGSEVYKLDIPGDLKLLNDEYDLIFADPPHSFTEFEALLTAIHDFGLLKEGGRIVLEHNTHAKLEDAWGGFTRLRHKKYGQTSLSFYA